MLTISIPKDYMGQCICGHEAKHKVWTKFANPRPYPPALSEMLKAQGLPSTAPAGIWQNKCTHCLLPGDLEARPE